MILISNLFHFSHAEKGHRSQGPMVSNPIYESGELYEELPDGPVTVARPLKSNGMTITPQVPELQVPELPPPRMNGHVKVDENAVSAKRSSQRPKSMGGLSLSSQREEDCYTVMSPAGTLTILPRNRHSTGSLGPYLPWPNESSS